MAKGFGAEPPKKKEKTEGTVKREQQDSKYDEISGAGGQEYLVFVRQFGSEDDSWLPTGTIAVPRGAQVSDAIFANEKGLKESIVRTYVKLAGSESDMEFGYTLKMYPDEPVQVATKSLTGGKTDGPSITNWISNLLSPIDNSKMPPSS